MHEVPELGLPLSLDTTLSVPGVHARSKLVRRAGQAAAQESSHATDCFSLASAYAGQRLGPQALDLGTAAPIARSLAELAA